MKLSSKLLQIVKQEFHKGSFAMGLRRHIWWVAVFLLMVCGIGLIIAAYQFDWSGTGFLKKTLWDWMQLLIIPSVLAVVAIWFNHAERNNEQKIASDNQQETMLQGYLDKMSELLLHEKIREPVFQNALGAQNEAQHVARARTFTVLSKLDANRKRSVIQFLQESHLIYKDECIVHLNDADLSGADLSGAFLGYSDLSKTTLSKTNLSKAILAEADLSNANLSRATLREARLSWGKLFKFPTGAVLEHADMTEANLSGAIMDDVILINANLSGANLSGASLYGADLTKANLTKALITSEQLKTIKSLQGTILPDGSTHP